MNGGAQNDVIVIFKRNGCRKLCVLWKDGFSGAEQTHFDVFSVCGNKNFGKRMGTG